ncbi:MAG TPA: response regulator transcription factor [Acidimicrobiales bacterium]|nr:response regulator transcription factor [Acidimicrobiales bacterium]
MIVEDDATVSALLSRVLETEGYQVQVEAAARPAIDRCHASQPDLVLVDIDLGRGTNGLAFIGQLRSLSNAPIVIVSGATDPADIQAGFAAGADMYVEKPFDVDKLLARVAGLLGGRREVTPQRWKVADVMVDREGRVVARNGQKLNLPRREFDLFCALARRPGRVLSKEQLLGEVWGYEEYDDNVVERRVSSLRTKLEAHGPRLIHTVWGSGYVLRA